MSAATGAATAAQQSTPKKGATVAKTEVRTTIGKTVEADERELVDLKRLGLIATKKDQRAATAAIADAEAQRVEADTKGKGD